MERRNAHGNVAEYPREGRKRRYWKRWGKKAEDQTGGGLPENGEKKETAPKTPGTPEDVPEETQTVEDPDAGEEDEAPYQGGFPWGNMGFGIPIGQIDLNAITGKKRVKKKKEGQKKELFKLKDIPAPHAIKEKLDQYVIGQEQAKKVISVAVYNTISGCSSIRPRMHSSSGPMWRSKSPTS